MMKWKSCWWLLVSLLISCGSKDPEGPAKLSFKETMIEEGDDVHSQILTLVADRPLPAGTSLSYALREGQAKLNQDIKASSGSLNMEGKTELPVSIEVVGDTNLEIQETFDMVLTYNGVEVVFPIVIVDDDAMEDINSDGNGYFTDPTHPSMELVWSDEFNTGTLDLQNWAYELGNGCDAGVCGWGNNELETYTNASSNIYLQGGFLTITARASSGNYTSARIKTEGKQQFRYGRIDVRARLPKGQGIWPAIWLLGTNISSVGWPACGEIDMMEMVGHQPAQVYGTVHYDNGGHKSSSGSTGLSQGTFADKYHVFSIVWDINKITWYVDNKSFKTFSNSGKEAYPFNSEFFMILNIAVGGSWPGDPDNTTSFPQRMSVDYIRVFQ